MGIWSTGLLDPLVFVAGLGYWILLVFCFFFRFASTEPKFFISDSYGQDFCSVIRVTAKIVPSYVGSLQEDPSGQFAWPETLGTEGLWSWR